MAGRDVRFATRDVDEVEKITCPVSLHFGEIDPIAPMEEVDAIRKAFAGRKNADIGIHGGASHNFAMPYKNGYDAAVAKESRERCCAASARCERGPGTVRGRDSR